MKEEEWMRKKNWLTRKATEATVNWDISKWKWTKWIISVKMSENVFFWKNNKHYCLTSDVVQTSIAPMPLNWTAKEWIATPFYRAVIHIKWCKRVNSRILAFFSFRSKTVSFAAFHLDVVIVCSFLYCASIQCNRSFERHRRHCTAGKKSTHWFSLSLSSHSCLRGKSIVSVTIYNMTNIFVRIFLSSSLLFHNNRIGVLIIISPN